MRLAPRRAGLPLLLLLIGCQNLYGRDLVLAWDPNTEPQLAGYRLYRGQSARAYDTVVDVGGVSTWTVRDLVPGTYFFAVTAYDFSGWETGYSNEILVVIHNPPPAPSLLSPSDGTASFPLTPVLSWSASPGAASYDVYFGTSSIPPLVMTTTGTVYFPPTLAAGTTYYWMVVARNDSGSTASVTLSFTTTATLMPAPAMTTKTAVPRLAADYGPGPPNSGDAQYTRIAIANVGNADAFMRLTAFSPEGLPATGAALRNPLVFTLATGQQVQIIDDLLFGDGLIGGGGSLQVESSSDAIAGYFTVFDTALSVLDGVALPTTTTTAFVLPEVENRGNTRVRIANPGENRVTLDVSVIGGDGATRQSTTMFIDPGGSLSESFSTLFPVLVPLSSDYLLITADHGVVPVELFGTPAGDIKALIGLDKSHGARTLYAPQYAVGDSWRSSVSVINVDPVAGTVTLRLRGEDGLQIGESRTESIPAHGKLHIEDPKYFGDYSGRLIQGYLEIVGSGPGMVGSVTFADPQGKSGAAALPLTGTLHTSLIFPRVASDHVVFTGIALLNPAEGPAQVTLDLYAANGTRIATSRQTIPARGRVCRLLSEYLPPLAGLSLDSGYLKIESDTGIAAFALFGTQTLSSIAASAAQPAR